MDTFRRDSRPLSTEEIDEIDYIKEISEDLEDEINMNTNKENGREMALAKTKLEESVMWAVKGITK